MGECNETDKWWSGMFNSCCLGTIPFLWQQLPSSEISPLPYPWIPQSLKTCTNPNGPPSSFQNLPVASDIHSVWGKVLSSTWTSMFGNHSLAFWGILTTPWGQPFRTAPPLMLWSEKKAGLWLAQREPVGRKEQYHS